MVARKRLTERQTIRVLIAQGAILPCYRCRVALKDDDLVEREHIHEIALGGEDSVENCAFSHKECHKLVTSGNGATTAGSSAHKIAKVKRLRGERKQKEKKPWPAGRKIPSRPFARR